MADGRGYCDRMGSYVFCLSNRGGCVVIVDLFAGPGGWSEGLRMLSPELHATEIGLEWDAAACETRAAAGHATIRTNIAAYPLDQFGDRVTGLIASPPCQDFSLAGKRAGIEGERGQLIREVLRWSEGLRPEWIACEQVPPALPVWRDYETELRKLGYSTWSGVLNAADYGVPQTRRRAILVASRMGSIGPPNPTHDREPMPSLFADELQPWVSMLSAINKNYMLRHDSARHDRPRNKEGKQPVRDKNGDDFYFRMNPARPCWTVTTNAGNWKWETGDGDKALTIEDTLTLQSFPKNYPLQGTRKKQFQQVGNAVPPRLAAHILARVTGKAFNP